MSGGPFNGKAVLTGAGKSQVGRRIGRTGLDLTLEAVLRAIEDAGLHVDDVDGIASYPGPGVPDRGFLRRDRPGGPQCAGPAVPLVCLGDGDRGPDRPGDRGVHGRHPGIGQPRRRVPVGVGIHRGARVRRQPRVGALRRRRTTTASGMGGAVRRVVGGELAGDARAALHVRLRADPEHLGHIAINARKNAGLNPRRDLSRTDDAWTTTSAPG